MTPGLRTHAAGAYAWGRYRKGLANYRRRMRPVLWLVVAPPLVAVALINAVHPLDWWSFVAGALATAAVAFASFVRDEPPGHVLKWRLGAEGERMTERALGELENDGWTAKHDIPHERSGNLDHVLSGPPEVFLLETKNLSGTISIESGCLVSRQLDDDEEIFRHYRLAGRMRGRAKQLSAWAKEDTGRGTWVHAVVVIWGHFPEGFVQHDNVTYISGSRLTGWLRSLPAARSDVEIAS